VELPRVRRYRKGEIDRLYVENAEGLTYGWAETLTGDITVQIPGSEARLEAALNAWAHAFPDDDLASHVPGRSTVALASAWDAEIAALDEDARMLSDMRAEAIYQRDQYRKGNGGEQRIGVALNKLYERGWGVLHAIPVYDGRADIDHLLIGSGGGWTVNAKAHGALPIRVNGDRMSVGRMHVDHIRAARHERDLVQRVLQRLGFKVPVYAAVALDITPRTEFRVVSAPGDVLVARTEPLVGEIQRSGGIVDQETINRMYSALRQRTTWETTP
jgi:hypothetical protein